MIRLRTLVAAIRAHAATRSAVRVMKAAACHGPRRKRTASLRGGVAVAVTSLGPALTAAGAPLAGQRVVHLPAVDRAVQPRLTDVFRAGKTEGASWELYGKRVQTGFDGAGNLYIFDPDNFRVVVVSPTGAFLREVGKRGGGPGELSNPREFAVLRDGTVVIADIGRASFVVYDRTATYQHSVSFATESVTTLGTLLADPRGGAIISSGRRITMTEAGSAGAPVVPRGRPIMRFELAAGTVGTRIHMAWDPTTAANPGPAGDLRGTTMRVGGGRAFEPALLAGALPGGAIAFSDSSAYAIRILAPDGTIQTVLQRPIRPQAMNGRIQQAEKDRRLAELETAGDQVRFDGRGGGAGGAARGEAMRRNIEQLQFYHELPVVTGLATSWSGKIWVARRGDDIDRAGPVDLLTPGGEYLGTIAAEVTRTPSAFGPNGLAAFIETDALGVVTVAVRMLPADFR